MKCTYCNQPGRERMAPDEESAVVCDGCWKILKNPRTALPFLRGHMTLQLRGTMPEAELNKRLNAFMEQMAKMKRPG